MASLFFFKRFGFSLNIFGDLPAHIDIALCRFLVVVMSTTNQSILMTVSAVSHTLFIFDGLLLILILLPMLLVTDCDVNNQSILMTVSDILLSVIALSWRSSHYWHYAAKPALLSLRYPASCHGSWQESNHHMCSGMASVVQFWYIYGTTQYYHWYNSGTT